ncbi:hypothetical protein AB0E01_05065 [Nocardia vinacea]|uniref:hypothetical protein n=1 Tax=Nocardia vinacea TaxID=96468 RepID=UPI0033FD2525
MEDVELFGVVAKHGCHVFVTGDMRQLLRDHERAACRKAGLHWVGVHHVQSTGYHVIAGPASTLVHALPFALAQWGDATEPQFFKLRKSERNYMKVFESYGRL